MTDGQNWGVPPQMPTSSTPPPTPTFGTAPPPSAGPPPFPASAVSCQYSYVAPVQEMWVGPHLTYSGGYARPDKSLGIAYLLWLFLGLFGIHHFYLGKWQRGLWYVFTFAFFGIGWCVDMFTLPWQVERVNAERRAGLR